MRRSTALAPVIGATLLAGVVAVALRAGGESSPSVGHLASLLAHHHAHAIARAVAPESRSTLSAGRLQFTWDAITAVTGPMQGTPKTIVVHEAGGATDEIELVQFGGRH